MYSSPPFDEGRSLGHDFGCGDESRLVWRQRHVVYFVLYMSSAWFSLQGVRNCGGRHGLASRLDLLGLLVFSFLFGGFVWDGRLVPQQLDLVIFGCGDTPRWVVCRNRTLGGQQGGKSQSALKESLGWP